MTNSFQQVESYTVWYYYQGILVKKSLTFVTQTIGPRERLQEYRRKAFAYSATSFKEETLSDMQYSVT